jgi:hypothetical protein
VYRATTDGLVDGHLNKGVAEEASETDGVDRCIAKKA